MADIFTSKDIKSLLKGKFILILGDSNMRAAYRDFVWLLNNNALVPGSHLRRKLDFSYLDDRLIKQGELNRGRDYIEMREYLKDDFYVKYNFLTRCITKEVEEMIQEFKEEKTKSPDVIIINSCLWDISRWGPDGVSKYKENMRKLFSLFKASLPPTTLVIFATTPPVSPSCSGAFLVKQIEFMKHSLRFEVMEANLFVRQLVPTYGYDVLDLHYHLRMQIHRRNKDGVHWFPSAVRHMTNLFLTHISLCWGVPLPGNFEGKLLNRMKANLKSVTDIEGHCTLPAFNIPTNTIMAPPPVPDKNNRRKYPDQVKRANVENTRSSLRRTYRPPNLSTPMYVKDRFEENAHPSTADEQRSVFGHVDPNVEYSVMLDFTADTYDNGVPIQNPIFPPYPDYQQYVGAHRPGRSYDLGDKYGQNYGPYRNRSHHRYGRPY